MSGLLLVGWLMVVAVGLSPATAGADEPALKVGYRVRVSEPGFFQYGPLEFAAPVVSADGRFVVVGTRTGLLSVRHTDSGEEAFSRTFIGGISASPLLLEDSIVVGSDNGEVARLSYCDGSPKWKESAQVSGAIRTPPVIVGNVIFVQDDSSVVHAIAADTGVVLAEHAKYSFARRGLTPFTIYGFPALLAQAGYLYAGFETGHIARFKLPADDAAFADFEEDWTVGPCAPGALAAARQDGQRPLCSSRRAFRDVDTSPTMTPEGLLVGCYCRGMLLLDPESGKSKWETAILGPSAPLVAGDRAFVTSADGAVYALELATGKILWIVDVGVAFLAPPALLGSPLDRESASLLVVTGKTMYVLDLATGKVLAKVTSFGGVSAPPAVVGQTVFLLSNEGFFYRIDYFR